MLRILDRKSDIEKAQQLFGKQFEPFIDERVATNIGYKGGGIQATVSWSSIFGLWLYLGRVANGNRYWNAFGQENPREHHNLSITCEINFPLEGINRRVSGAFASDDSGRLFLLYRGRIGGGRPGISKSLFSQNYSGEWTDVRDGELDTKVALIAALGSTNFTQRVGQFVYEIERIKALATSH